MAGHLESRAQRRRAIEAELVEAHDKAARRSAQGKSESGQVRARIGGDMRLRKLEIDPALLDQERGDELIAEITSAINAALESAQEMMADKTAAALERLRAPGAD